jgi:GH35 family endo-1,4-beta-xylanase
MKHMNKIFGTMLLATTLFSSCADMDPLDFAFEKPASIEGMEYLADYKALKDYKSENSSVSPNFKLGMALAATDYNADGIVTRIANANFDEIVAGNEMKMSSIVNDKGGMDFGTVDAFLMKAADNGVNVYGHTLAWHAQQPVKWLNSLIKDKELDIDPDAKLEEEQYMQDWTTADAYNMWGQFSEATGAKITMDGGLNLTTTNTINNFWELQYMIADGMTVQAGKDYVLRVQIKGQPEGSVHFVIGAWGKDIKTGSLSFTGDWESKDISFSFGEDVGGVHVLFQSGDYAGSYTVGKVQLLSLETPAMEVEQEIYSMDWSKADSYNMWGQFSEATGAVVTMDGGLHLTTTSKINNFWELQYMVADGFSVKSDTKYVMHITIKGSPATTNLHYVIGGWGNDIKTGTIAFDDGWATKDIPFTPGSDVSGVHVLLQSGDYVGSYTVKDVSICELVSMNAIPLTPEEKKDTLTWAMDKWISGMMEACGGRVKAWDVVNEAISGADTDGDGIYELQHGTEGNTSDFFWQDYLGDLDYIRTVVSKAREYGPEGVQLFINDYNLESDWDNNAKLKSLIEWIKRWEADGVTKIDGIGTQMHLKYYSNKAIQDSKEKAIVEMFKLMAASKKLVRVSELDIEFVDANGNNVNQGDMSESQLKTVANFYKWIIQQYITLIPAAQQYGFCIWTAIDADPSTSWTHQQLYGLWDKNYSRTHAYGSFADGLSGK